MFKKTFLYVKTHLTTGLKYFGKTTDDPFTYNGSGVYWKKHLKKHGCNLHTEIIGTFLDEDACKKLALNFSIENDIVNSDQWANLKIEELDGGWDHINSNEELRRAKNSKAGKICNEKHPEIVKENLSKGRTSGAALKGASTKREKYGNDFYVKIASKPCSEETKKKLSEIAKKNKNGAANLGKKRDKIKCPHCEKEGAKHVMFRWHFDNCKK